MLIALVPALAMILDMQFPVSERGQSYVVGELVESLAKTLRGEALEATARTSASDAQRAVPTAEPQVAAAETDRDLADKAEFLMRDLLCRAGNSASCRDTETGPAAAGPAESLLSQSASDVPLAADQAPGADPDVDGAAAGNKSDKVAGTWTFAEISSAEAETDSSAQPVEVPEAPVATVEETLAAPIESATEPAAASVGGGEIEATIPGSSGGTAVAGQMDLARQAGAATEPPAIESEPESAQHALAPEAQAAVEASPPIKEPADPAAPLPALSQPAARDVAISEVAPIPENDASIPAQPAQFEEDLAPEAGGATQAASLVPPFSTPNDPIQSENESLVFLIQDRLNRLGFTGAQPVKLDGRLGPDTTSAIAAYQRAHSLAPDGRASLHLLNHLDAQLTGQRGQPRQSLQASLAQPKLADSRGGYESFRRGLAAARGGRSEDAINYYTEAVDTVGWLERHLALAKRGDVYSKLGNYDTAIADYSAAIRLKPDYADAYVSRAFAYQAKDQDDKAVADYRQARLLDPDNKWIAEQLQRLGAEP